MKKIIERVKNILSKINFKKLKKDIEKAASSFEPEIIDMVTDEMTQHIKLSCQMDAMINVLCEMLNLDKNTFVEKFKKETNEIMENKEIVKTLEGIKGLADTLHKGCGSLLDDLDISDMEKEIESLVGTKEEK